MKNVLLVGCGRNFGYNLANCYLDAGYSVWTMGSHSIEGCNSLEISWNTLSTLKLRKIANQLPNLDSIFFNQYDNGASIQYNNTNDLAQELTAWSHAYWINCQMPVYLIKMLTEKINKKTKVCWQIGWQLGSEDKLNLDHPDDNPAWQNWPYGSQKITNFMIMKACSKSRNGIYYATYPGHLTEENRKERAEIIFKIQESVTEKDNGRAIHYDGTDYIKENKC